MVECVGSYLDANVSGESVAMKSHRKTIQSYNSCTNKMSFLFQKYVDCCVTL